MKITGKRKKDSVTKVPKTTCPRQHQGEKNQIQQKLPSLKVTIGSLSDAESKRFDVAVDLLLADIVRRIIETGNSKKDEKVKSKR